MRVRAYAAYLLTRQGIVTTATLSSLRENLRANFEEKLWRDDLVAVYLAASYQLLQQQALADDLISTPISQLGKSTAAYSYQYYYDPLIHDAETLYILAKHFLNSVQALPTTLFQNIVKGLTEDRYNTLSSAYLLLAYAAYVDAVPPNVTQSLAISAIDAAGQSLALSLPANFAPRVSFPETTKKLHFSGDGSAPLYYAVSESGYDQQAPTAEVHDGLEITRVYFNAKGETVTKATLGEELTVQLRIRAIDHDWINDLVVQDLLPAGFEAVIQTPVAKTEDAPATDGEASGEESADDSTSWWKDRLSIGGNWKPQYADIREDRVVLYGSITNELAEYQYKIKAISAGVFNVPPIYATDMYQPNLV